MFSKILIANRGEISCRVTRTAHKLGIQTVAVYSDADTNALHVEVADEAVHIGPAPSRESYLCIDKIIAAAKETGAQAIHPGYGFLSENAGFAAACRANHLVFIGPSAEAITAMGSKSGAKALMEKAGVPLVPGYHGENQEPSFLLEQARQMGFPVLLKASAGGGGKGMRAVHHESEFTEALEAAQREALNAFSDQRMLVEKLLIEPRHVEVQVLADVHGNCVYVFDRDCSIQRRHQKVVEEAPAPGLSDELRKAMGEASVRAALAINYQGAGTLEFLVDKSGAFYFMEMNTRLQVEHPVSELISGLDLVEWQLRVATGEALPFKQSDLAVKGHAIEVRLYAEDPDNEFLPSTGQLRTFNLPQGEGLRMDTGYRSGDHVSVHYDPMMAKLIAWGDSREQAAARLHQALQATCVAGVRHNAAFLAQVLAHPAFIRGELHTGFIEQHQQDLLPASSDKTIFYLLAALILQYGKSTSAGNDGYSPWQSLSHFRTAVPDSVSLSLVLEGDAKTIQLTPHANGFNWQSDERNGHVLFALSDTSTTNNGKKTATLVIDNKQHSYTIDENSFGIDIFHQGRHLNFIRPTQGSSSSNTEKNNYNAPMNGRIVNVSVKTGDDVKKGDTLLVMEAMKMEHRIRAHCDGSVKTINVCEGALVSEGQTLVDIEAAS